MHKIKFGVIGCGHIGKRHASMVQQNDECELIALCDAAQKDTLGLEGLDVPFYATPEEMLANEPSIEVVCICTPNGYHFQHARLCLDHHKHVLVEKP
ncbi:MAG: Gfo/Idh/MocA family oxidoreductase, partial [Bacteroidia bacterium]